PFPNGRSFQMTPLEDSFHFQTLYSVEKFLEQNADKTKIDPLFDNLNSISLVYYASKLGYPNLLEAVIKRNRNVVHFKIGKDKLSFLHVAVKGGTNSVKSESIFLYQTLIFLFWMISKLKLSKF